MANPTIRILRAGDTTKSVPFTICIVANPALEAPWQTGQLAIDPIVADPVAFDTCAAYIDQSLFGGLANQREQVLADPAIASLVRVISVFESGLPPADANSLVAQDSSSDLLIARRGVFRAFLAARNLNADIVYAVSNSGTHTRASAWFTSDDDARGGISFTLDGQALTHRYQCLIPGTIAIHSTATSLTAVHEFHHAISSYTNGSIVDLYVDSGPALNCRRSRPIPANFAVYNGVATASDTVRDHLGYPPGWQSYHCELNNPNLPAIMDNYWLAAPTSDPNVCENDRITRQFVTDRVRAKLSR